jgi:hypothetical protein
MKRGRTAVALGGKPAQRPSRSGRTVSKISHERRPDIIEPRFIREVGIAPGGRCACSV